MKETARFDIEFDRTARLFGVLLRDLEEKYADTWTRVAHSRLSRTQIDLGMESEIVVRMPPLSSRGVKVRPKHVQRPMPRVLYDPTTGD